MDGLGFGGRSGVKAVPGDIAGPVRHLDQEIIASLRGLLRREFGPPHPAALSVRDRAGPVQFLLRAGAAAGAFVEADGPDPAGIRGLPGLSGPPAPVRCRDRRHDRDRAVEGQVPPVLPVRIETGRSAAGNAVLHEYLRRGRVQAKDRRFDLTLFVPLLRQSASRAIQKSCALASLIDRPHGDGHIAVLVLTHLPGRDQDLRSPLSASFPDPGGRHICVRDRKFRSDPDLPALQVILPDDHIDGAVVRPPAGGPVLHARGIRQGRFDPGRGAVKGQCDLCLLAPVPIAVRDRETEPAGSLRLCLRKKAVLPVCQGAGRRHGGPDRVLPVFRPLLQTEGHHGCQDIPLPLKGLQPVLRKLQAGEALLRQILRPDCDRIVSRRPFHHFLSLSFPDQKGPAGALSLRLEPDPGQDRLPAVRPFVIILLKLPLIIFCIVFIHSFIAVILCNDGRFLLRVGTISISFLNLFLDSIFPGLTAVCSLLRICRLPVSLFFFVFCLCLFFAFCSSFFFRIRVIRRKRRVPIAFFRRVLPFPGPWIPGLTTVFIHPVHGICAAFVCRFVWLHSVFL